MNPDLVPVPEREHAVVIGGSAAGMLAARVLAEHFRHVTILERDRLPDGPEFRKGVPQSRQPHVLLKKGLLLLEERFPGLSAALLEAGAVPIGWPADTLWMTPNGWLPRDRSDVEFISCSRELLDWNLRRLLAAHGRVRFLPETEAAELLTSPDRSRVTGVRLRARAPGSPESQELGAALIVDASGRDSRLPRWLEEQGYPAPEETQVDAGLRYTTRYFARPPGIDWKLLMMPAFPPTTLRSAALFPIEGDRWLGGVVGCRGDLPPTDEEGFLAYARGLPDPFLYEVLKRAEPISPIVGYQRTNNRLRHYERTARFPERLLVMGDALCSFNPVYGQGITVAALEAELLDECLREWRSRRPEGELSGLSRSFQQRAAECIAVPWRVAMSEDVHYPTAEGARPDAAIRMIHWYFGRLQRGMASNAELRRTFGLATHLLAPPTLLVRPSVLWSVLRGGFAPGLAQVPTATPPETWVAGEAQRAK